MEHQGWLLAQVTFTNGSASGWQPANFATPVAIHRIPRTSSPITPLQPYDCLYGWWFVLIDRQLALHALASVAPAGGNGVYRYDFIPEPRHSPRVQRAIAQLLGRCCVHPARSAARHDLQSDIGAGVDAPERGDPSITSAGGVDVGIKFTSGGSRPGRWRPFL